MLSFSFIVSLEKNHFFFMGSDPESFLKWLSRLIPIKRSDALTATLGNDSGSKESVNQQQRRELPLPLFINSSEMFIFSLWGLTPEYLSADVLTMSKGQLRPVLIKDMELAVDVVLHQQQSLLGHLLAVAVDELDAVIVIRIVAGGDHNATVKVIHTGDIDHRRRGSDVQQVGVCAGSSQTSHETVLKHIRTAASILANDDTGRVGVTVTLSESIIIPAQESTNLIGMVRC